MIKLVSFRMIQRKFLFMIFIFFNLVKQDEQKKNMKKKEKKSNKNSCWLKKLWLSQF